MVTAVRFAKLIISTPYKYYKLIASQKIYLCGEIMSTSITSLTAVIWQVMALFSNRKQFDQITEYVDQY